MSAINICDQQSTLQSINDDRIGLLERVMGVVTEVRRVRHAETLKRELLSSTMKREEQVMIKQVRACRKGGTISVPGVYGAFLDKFPFGAAFSKGLTFKMAQTNVTNIFDRC